MERFGFFNDVDNDRVYYAEDVARYFTQYFTNGIFNNGCLVLANNENMSINVSNGSANINGYRYDNDSTKVLVVDNADGVLNRIDNIVIRLDLTNRTITSQVVKGVFADNPVAPDLVRTSTVYDLRIAKVSVPAGTTTITQDLVEDTRFINSDCGNVICAVQTPNTEELYLQLYAKANKLISDSQNDLNKFTKDFKEEFNTWFDTIKNTLDGDIAGNLSNRISDVENRINRLGSALKYCGSVDNYGDLPSDAEIGDTYNISNSSEKNEAGDNAVWTGTDWDILSGVIDLSNYALKTDIPKWESATSEEEALTLSNADKSIFFYYFEE